MGRFGLFLFQIGHMGKIKQVSLEGNGANGLHSKVAPRIFLLPKIS